MTEYLDFELGVERASGRDYQVTVLRSPAGDAREVARPPTIAPELVRALGVGRDVWVEPHGAPVEISARAFGAALFDAVFTGDVRGRFDATLHEADLRRKRVRVALRIGAPELARLPWELLYDSERSHYVALSRKVVLSRYLPLPRPRERLMVRLPLRVLGVMSLPRDTPALNVADERARIEAATEDLRRSGLIDIHWLVDGDASVERLQTRLQDPQPWHVVHFIGHGRYDATTDKGQLAFTDRSGRAHWIGGHRLNSLLCGHQSLRLVLLNCCRSAQSSELALLSSTATQVVNSGVPAVVAMQWVVSDDGAIKFADQFYRALAGGHPVEAAVSEGRVAMHTLSEDDENFEWSLPVLHMRSSDGQLFDLETRSTRSPVDAKRARSFHAPPNSPKPAVARCALPNMLLAAKQGPVVGTDAGEWFAIEANGAVVPLPATGPFSAALVDASGIVTVACWESSIKQLRGAHWVEHMAVAPPLALVLAELGVVVGDALGGFSIVDAGSWFPVPDLAATAPILDLGVIGTSLAVVDASGRLAITRLPGRDQVDLATLDTGALGRPFALCPGIRAATLIAIGERGIGIVDGATLGSVVAEASVRAVAAFRGHDRACVVTDAGTAWIVDAALARVARIRLAGAGIEGLATGGDGTVLAWTTDGDLHSIGPDGAVRRMVEGDVVLAAPDPDDAAGYLAVHWTAERGLRVSRGRTTWT